MSINEKLDTAISIRMKCLNPKCNKFFRDRVVNFDYDKRQYDRPTERSKLVENVKISEDRIETYIVCDKCSQAYSVEIHKIKT